MLDDLCRTALGVIGVDQSNRSGRVGNWQRCDINDELALGQTLIQKMAVQLAL